MRIQAIFFDKELSFNSLFFSLSFQKRTPLINIRAFSKSFVLKIGAPSMARNHVKAPADDFSRSVA